MFVRRLTEIVLPHMALVVEHRLFTIGIAALEELEAAKLSFCICWLVDIRLRGLGVSKAEHFHIRDRAVVFSN